MAWFWIIGGHNGAGKSTLTPRLAGVPGFSETVVLDPDEFVRIPLSNLEDRNAANLGAVRVCEHVAEKFIARQTNVGLETVLSTDKYRRLVHSCKAVGGKFGFVYVCLSSAELAIARVRQRAAMGLHGVDPDKIVRRRTLSLAQMPWFMAVADVAAIYVNDHMPRLIATKSNGLIRIVDSVAVPEVTAALRTVGA